MKKLKKLNEEDMNKYKKRFMQLKEYSFINKEEDLLLDEDDDDTQNQGKTLDNDGLSQDNAQPPVDGQQQDVANQEQPEVNSQVQDNNGQVDLNNVGIETNGSDVNPVLDNQIQQDNPNEVEIDITDLTKKQDDIEAKVNKMSSETNSMLDLLNNLSNKIEGIISKTNDDIKNIKDEIVKRNPTPVEVLQKRITVSNPFSETPEDYWNKKEGEGRYKLSDNEEETYEITNSDLDSNPIDIYKSFGLKDDEVNQTLTGLLKY